MKLFFIAAILFTSLGVVFAQPTITMKAGAKQQVTMTGRAADNQATWMSSDPSVASVINSSAPALNGMVRARRAGTATITGTEGTAQVQTTVVVQP